MSIGIPPCITLNFTIIMGEKEHDGRHKGRLRRKAYVTGPSLAKATCGSWLKKWKATVTPDPNRPLRGNGSELHSPSHMSLGLSLRFKSVLRNSGRIYLAAARMETSPHSSSTTERARLPHFNEATCGFRSPALAGRIDFREIEFRGKTRRRAVLRIRNALLNIIIAIILQIEF